MGDSGIGKSALAYQLALAWLRRASGVRALINQTDVRLAIARRANNAGELVLSGHFRTRGDIGPFLIRRVWDAEGEPAGYGRFDPQPALIANADQEAAFRELPNDFSFTAAERTLPQAAGIDQYFHSQTDPARVGAKDGAREVS